MSDTIQTSLKQALEALGTVLSGKDLAIKKMLACMLAGGHVLIEDVPGTGKTSVAQSMARVLNLDYSRIQFTADLLPSDVLGSMIYEQKTATFRFQQGPIFTQLLLADEINRTSPKTQSALLEAMAEGQVTIDGKAYPLDKPFFVIATQNPSSQFGTFALPESQLDRFMLSLSIGYPSLASEKSLLQGLSGREQIAHLPAVFDSQQLLSLQTQVKSVQASESLIDYILRLVTFTREHEKLDYGISPRASLSLLACAKAWALIHGRDYVIPEDVQALIINAWLHRLIYAANSLSEAEAILFEMLKTVPVNA